MKVDLFSSAGEKKGVMELPASLFEAPINKGLMHEALLRQQSNRRTPVAHVKHRGEVAGSTKKLYAQKHTGRARRGNSRSPLLRGGGKSFGPRSNANFRKEMPRKMRRAALLSCLSLRAKEGAIIGLTDYPDTVKTKTFTALLKKLPVELGRRILVVIAGTEKGLMLSARNVSRVKTLFASYLNPEDILVSKHIIFLEGALKIAEDTFGSRIERVARKESEASEESEETEEQKPKKEESEEQKVQKAPKITKKSAPKKTPRTIKSKRSSDSSDSSVSSESSPKKK
ncbi:MAG: 50S ribosomal protein L4 [Candidatus Peribacteraceae bacterium]|nr:50S ribosomal protein L4 [Candidatus Peribacteraceae bacterium]